MEQTFIPIGARKGTYTLDTNNIPNAPNATATYSKVSKPCVRNRYTPKAAPIIIPKRAAQEKTTLPALRKVELVISMANVMPAVAAIPKYNPCTMQSINRCVAFCTNV